MIKFIILVAFMVVACAAILAIACALYMVVNE